jgi:XTP/dITP diphosphohydrolase
MGNKRDCPFPKSSKIGMRKLLVATTNPGKLKEISGFLSDLPLEIVSLSDIGIINPVQETGDNYKENSQMKALFYSNKAKLPTIADDAGIEIDALNGAPGLKSSRWLGNKSTEEDIVNYMLKLAKDLPDDKRRAIFKTVVSFALPNGKVWSAKGEIEGIIARKPYLKTLKGYPYRSFFYLPQIKKYYHEDQLTCEEQKEYNHRYKAINKLKIIIERELGIKI